VAWCENCAEMIADDKAIPAEDGTTRCPECNSVVVPDDDDEGPPKAPWHFKVLLVGTVIYLIYRLIWFIFWLRQHA
jgi:hypothetical protein